MNGRKEIISILVLLSFIGIAYGETPSLLLNPSIVWLNDNNINVKIDIICPQNYTYESVYGILEDNKGGFINLNNFIVSGDNTYSMTINKMYIQSGYGVYKVIGICKVNDSKTFSSYELLEVNQITSQIISPTKENIEEVYTDNLINTKFYAKINNQDILSNELYNIRAYLIDHISKNKYSLTDMVVGTEDNNIVITSRIP